MCGIAGIISPKGFIDPGELQVMSIALKHRGPDGYGYLLYSTSGGPRIWHNKELCGGPGKEQGSVGFAHRRLSIIDLSENSLQPMADETGVINIVYNGEI